MRRVWREKKHGSRPADPSRGSLQTLEMAVFSYDDCFDVALVVVECWDVTDC